MNLLTSCIQKQEDTESCLYWIHRMMPSEIPSSGRFSKAAYMYPSSSYTSYNTMWELKCSMLGSQKICSTIPSGPLGLKSCDIEAWHKGLEPNSTNCSKDIIQDTRKYTIWSRVCGHRSKHGPSPHYCHKAQNCLEYLCMLCIHYDFP